MAVEQDRPSFSGSWTGRRKRSYPHLRTSSLPSRQEKVDGSAHWNRRAGAWNGLAVLTRGLEWQQMGLRGIQQVLVVECDVLRMQSVGNGGVNWVRWWRSHDVSHETAGENGRLTCELKKVPWCEFSQRWHLCRRRGTAKAADRSLIFKMSHPRLCASVDPWSGSRSQAQSRAVAFPSPVGRRWTSTSGEQGRTQLQVPGF